MGVDEDLLKQNDKRSVEDRMLRVEWVVGLHSEAIDKLENSAQNIATDIRQIQQLLVQIKYAAFGAFVFYLVNTFGLPQVLKGLL